jgi:hypothetical protein
LDPLIETGRDGMTRKPPLILMLVISAVYGAALPFLPQEGAVARTADLAAGVPLLVCTVWWCQRDAVLREITFPKWLIWLIVLIGPIGLCVHFFRSRRPGEAVLAILVATLFVALLLVVALCGAVLSTWIACRTDSLVRYCPLEAA